MIKNDWARVGAGFSDWVRVGAGWVRVGAGGCGLGAGGCGWVRMGAGGCGWMRVDTCFSNTAHSHTLTLHFTSICTKLNERSAYE